MEVPESITYGVSSYDGQYMVVYIDVGGFYWTFTFEKDNSSNNMSDPYAPESRVLKVNRWDNSENSEDYSDWSDYHFTPKDSSGSPNIPLDQSLFSIFLLNFVFYRKPILFISCFPTCLSPFIKHTFTPKSFNKVVEVHTAHRTSIYGAYKYKSVLMLGITHSCFSLLTARTGDLIGCLAIKGFF